MQTGELLLQFPATDLIKPIKRVFQGKHLHPLAQLLHNGDFS